MTDFRKTPDENRDNIRIYVPLDLNKDAILRRLDSIIFHYGEANEANEFNFAQDVEMLISQIEIYDQTYTRKSGSQPGGERSGKRIRSKAGRNPGWGCGDISI